MKFKYFITMNQSSQQEICLKFTKNLSKFNSIRVYE